MWVESGGSQVESGRVWLQASDITGLIWATVAMGVAQKTAPNKPLVRHWWHCRTREEQRLLLCLFLLAHTFVSLGWSKIRVRFCMKATERRKSTKESRKCQLEHQPGIIRRPLCCLYKRAFMPPLCVSHNSCTGIPARAGPLWNTERCCACAPEVCTKQSKGLDNLHENGYRFNHPKWISLYQSQLFFDWRYREHEHLNSAHDPLRSWANHLFCLPDHHSSSSIFQ